VANLVASAKLSGVEPQAWLTDVLGRMVSGQTKATEVLPRRPVIAHPVLHLRGRSLSQWPDDWDEGGADEDDD
jgi:hypothetical protein